MKEKKLLIMITNNINPYMYDISQILALPKGALYRFRYTERWIKEKTLQSQSKKALIVARDFNEAKLYPIRYAQVNKVEQFGFIRYIEFLIGNYFTYPPNQHDINHKVNEFNHKISDYLGSEYRNIPKDDMTPLVFFIEPFPEYYKAQEIEYETVEEYKQWSQILQLLGKMESYSKFSFLKVISLKSIAGIEYTCSKLKSGRRGYKISGGKTFILDVLQSLPYDPNTVEGIEKPYKIEMQTEEEVLPKIKSTNYIVGCYDLLHFIFKSNIFKKDVNSFFEIFDHQEIQRPGMLPINMPVTIEIGKLRRIVRWLRIIIFFPLLSTFILAESVAIWIKLDVNILRNVLVLGLALCAGGFREILARIPQISPKSE